MLAPVNELPAERISTLPGQVFTFLPTTPSVPSAFTAASLTDERHMQLGQNAEGG